MCTATRLGSNVDFVREVVMSWRRAHHSVRRAATGLAVGDDSIQMWHGHDHQPGERVTARRDTEPQPAWLDIGVQLRD